MKSMKKIFVFFSVILFVGCFEKDNHVITYYDEAKKVIKEIYVVDPVSGLKDSVYKSFYENGNPKEIFVYKKGLRHGPAASYYELNSGKPPESTGGASHCRTFHWLLPHQGSPPSATRVSCLITGLLPSHPPCFPS